jgi:hypothetical protein
VAQADEHERRGQNFDARAAQQRFDLCAARLCFNRLLLGSWHLAGGVR